MTDDDEPIAQPDGDRLKQIAGLLEDALIHQLQVNPTPQILSVARALLRDNHVLSETRPESRLHLLDEEVEARMPFG